MDAFELIRTRRSIRKYTEEEVTDEVIEKIISAGMWAPSGRNNQPWKFAIIKDSDLKRQISELTHYSSIVQNANTLIAVFLDHSESYHSTKDAQAIGACIQNMLLYIHSIGLGAVWLGEILKNGDKVLHLVAGPETLELMAVISLGHPSAAGGTVSRKKLEETVFFKK